jgi:hypothetical protein
MGAQPQLDANNGDKISDEGSGLRFAIRTPVDQLEVREHPSVLFWVNANTWLDAIIRYLVASNIIKA